MKKKLMKLLMVLALTICLVGVCTIPVKADETSAATFEELKAVLEEVEEGDVINVTGYIEVKEAITVEGVTFQRNSPTGYLSFGSGASGSAFSNVTFDGAKSNANSHFLYAYTEQLLFDKCAFINCLTDEGGGGAVFVGGGTIVFTDCDFSGNFADYGGAVAFLGGNATFSGCSFKDNIAQNGNGGAIYDSGATITLHDCLIMDNTATGSGQDVYVDSFGALSMENTLDELKALYEAHDFILQGVFDDSDAEVDISSVLTEKGIVFRWEEIKESEPTEEVESTPTPSTGTNTGNTSTDTQPTNNYNYNPTIYNNVAASDTGKETDASPTSETSESASIQGTNTSATIESGSDTKTYTTTDDQSGNSTLEIRDGANTITININVGTAETNGSGVDASISAAEISHIDQVNDPMTASSSSEKVETVYMDKAVNWVDVIELLVICSMAVYLFKDKLKVNFQGSNKKKE